MENRIRNLSYSEFLEHKNSVKVVISVFPFAMFLTVPGAYWNSVSFCSTNEQMDGWWMDGQRDGQMDGRVNK